MAEGVGFEPTVGFPTLDFESSALNRTQPPFRIQGEHRTVRAGLALSSSIEQRLQTSFVDVQFCRPIRVIRVIGGFGSHEKCYN